MRKPETAVCGTACTVVWEVGKCESRRQMPFMISIYLLPDWFVWGTIVPDCLSRRTLFPEAMAGNRYLRSGVVPFAVPWEKNGCAKV